MKESDKPWIERKTGVPCDTKCFRCGITAEQSFAKGPFPTGIVHPEYCETYSFYCYGEHPDAPSSKHACPRCHKEIELEKTMKAMDAYAKRHGEKALANRMGLR